MWKSGEDDDIKGYNICSSGESGHAQKRFLEIVLGYLAFEVPW